MTKPCRTCGALVADMDLHRRWHGSADQLEPLVQAQARIMAENDAREQEASEPSPMPASVRLQRQNLQVVAEQQRDAAKAVKR